MRICPKCGEVVSFNSYFGAYQCENCGWEDASYREERIKYYFENSKARTPLLARK